MLKCPHVKTLHRLNSKHYPCCLKDGLCSIKSCRANVSRLWETKNMYNRQNKPHGVYLIDKTAQDGLTDVNGGATLVTDIARKWVKLGIIYKYF